MPIGQRDQSAAALPIGGGDLATAIARFPPRVIAGVAFATRVVVTVVVVTRVAFFGLSNENFSSFASLFEMLITSTSSLSVETVRACRTLAAPRNAGPAGRNAPPSALRAPYCVWSASVWV